MDPGKLAFVQKYLEDVQDRDTRSMTTEVSDSGLATHTAASELGTEEINGKLVMFSYCFLLKLNSYFKVKFFNCPVSVRIELGTA